MNKSSPQTSLRIWPSITLTIALVAISSIFLIGGCSQIPLTDDQSLLNGDSYFNQTYVDDGFTKESALATLNGGGSVGIYYGEALISGAYGGSINIDMIGNVLQFVVQSDGMDSSKMISIGVSFTSYNGKILARFDCGPDGLQFNKSSVLSFPVSVLGNNKSSIDLYLLSSNGRWILQGTYSSDVNGMVNVPIDHFSMYGVE